MQWPRSCGTFYNDFVELSVGILGDAPSGGHQAAMTYLIDTLNSEELPQLVPSVEVCSFGLATGLDRACPCLAAVPTSPSPMRLQRLVADTVLRNLESTRLGT